MMDIKESFSSEFVIDRLILGDQQLLLKFVTKYDRDLKNAAKRIGFRGERLEDLVQSTWTSFFESIGRFKKQSHIRTFLFGIMLNKAREIWKKDKRELFFSDEGKMEEIVNQFKNDCNNCQYCTCLVGPEKELGARQLLGQLDQSLLKMDKKYSQILYDKFVEEKSTHDLCRDNHISSSNLGVIIHRVRKKLEEDF